ncbi:Gfo/Idh/MocA family protein [Conexibacter woesei]|uniref:Gfo/Idh/MocA family protein n=1 Tax=Conexibacter woesei TaxID=191495 RepID=UPI000405E438|nr:Gfo/Idh/MocA family oxidoreductase [Conexibacter woesei]
MESSVPPRGAVIGLGMMGRHHARILQSNAAMRFAGAVDPGGDRFGAVADRARVFGTIEEMLAVERPEFAVVAVPTEEHLPAVRELTAAGVNVLVEKPVAATAAEAREIIGLVADAGLVGAVGHVERCNPALRELRRRLPDLGEVYSVATERVGPFPDRIRDVGVVKDLATHDLDLVRWLGGAPIARVAAQTSHRMGRDHEDLVLVTGRLANDRAFNCVVDWLTPRKIRETRVLGEGGMFVADTLNADLWFYANAHVSTGGWAADAARRGVAEGDVTKFALRREEPLAAELEAFCALVGGNDSAPVVTLAEGLETVVVAEAVLESAASGASVDLTGSAA